MIDRVRLTNLYKNSSVPPSKRIPDDAEFLLREPGEKGVVYEPSGKPGEQKGAASKQTGADIATGEAAPATAAAAPTRTKSSAPTTRAGTMERDSLTLSIDSLPHRSAVEKNEQGENSSSLLNSIKAVVDKVVSAFKNFFSVIWNGPDQEAGAEQNTAESADTNIEAVHSVGGDAPVGEVTAGEASAGEASAGEVSAGAVSVNAVSADSENITAHSGKSEASAAINTLNEIIRSRDKQKLINFLTEDGHKKPARSTDLLTSYDNRGRIVRVDPSDRKRILEGDRSSIGL